MQVELKINGMFIQIVYANSDSSTFRDYSYRTGGISPITFVPS